MTCLRYNELRFNFFDEQLIMSLIEGLSSLLYCSLKLSQFQFQLLQSAQSYDEIHYSEQRKNCQNGTSSVHDERKDNLANDRKQRREWSDLMRSIVTQNVKRFLGIEVRSLVDGEVSKFPNDYNRLTVKCPTSAC